MSDLRSSFYIRELFDTKPVVENPTLKTIGQSTYQWKANVKKQELPRWLSMTMISNYVTDEPKATKTMTVDQLNSAGFVGVWTRID